jgi:hypothetical protein
MKSLLIHQKKKKSCKNPADENQSDGPNHNSKAMLQTCWKLLEKTRIHRKGMLELKWQWQVK